MTSYVVDTNVAVVANGRDTHASVTCQLKCVERLQQIVSSGIIAIDDAQRILDEYARNLRHSGQPGVGDAFFKHVRDHQANPDRCELVAITPAASGSENYAEFPQDQRLSGFDPNDRKFVAVALASALSPTIQNAVDTGYWNFNAALAANGVRIDFLCPEMMTRGGAIGRPDYAPFVRGTRPSRARRGSR